MGARPGSAVSSPLHAILALCFAKRPFFHNGRSARGLVPGGGPMARLPRLMGRGRALEVLLGAEDIDGDLAQLYGYVNCSLRDRELDDFVDAFAKRIASFNKQAIAETKHLVDVASLPPDVVIGARMGRVPFLRAASRQPSKNQEADGVGLSQAGRCGKPPRSLCRPAWQFVNLASTTSSAGVKFRSWMSNGELDD